MEKNALQKAIDGIGEDCVRRYLPKGMKMCNCDMHGKYLAHYTVDNPVCPICAIHTGNGDGTTATQVEHYIDLRDNTNMGLRNFYTTLGGLDSTSFPFKKAPI